MGNMAGNPAGSAASNSAGNMTANASGAGSLDGLNNSQFNADAPSKVPGAANSLAPKNDTAPKNPVAPSTNALLTANAAPTPGSGSLTGNVADLSHSAPPANALPPMNGLPVANSSSSASPEVPPVAEPVKKEKIKHGVTQLTPEEIVYWKAAAAKLKNLAPEDAPKEYIVQPGDTLWDIADQLLDDSGWWPKLWVLNPQINSPHLIFPGQKLVFDSSDGSSPPVLAVRDIGKATPVAANALFVTRVGKGVADGRNDEDGLFIDPRQLGTDPSISAFGSAFPAGSVTVLVPGFLSNSTPDSVGTVVRKGDAGIITNLGQVTYAETDHQSHSGERFLAIRKTERGPNPNGESAFDPDFYMYTGVVGVVKVHKSGLVSLLVEETTTGVMESDLLIPFKNIHQIIDPAAAPRVANIKAEVLAVSGPFRGVAMPGHFVVLERSDGSASPGEDIELFMPAGGIVKFEEDDVDPVSAAKARIVEVNGDSVTAVILNATREVSVGARTWPEF